MQENPNISYTPICSDHRDHKFTYQTHYRSNMTVLRQTLGMGDIVRSYLQMKSSTIVKVKIFHSIILYHPHIIIEYSGVIKLESYRFLTMW